MSFLRPRYLVGLLVLVVLGACAAGFRGDIPLSDLKQRLATAHSHYVEVQETRLHYIDRGKGPVLLLLHGSGADVSAWRDVAAELAGTYRVLAVDMPGTGLSEVAADGEYRIGDRVGYLTGFLDALDVQPAALVGHSVGGQVAWTAALTRPRRVQRLILLAPTGYPHPSPLTWRLAQVPLLGELLQKFTPRFVVRMNLNSSLGAG